MYKNNGRKDNNGTGARGTARTVACAVLSAVAVFTAALGMMLGLGGCDPEAQPETKNYEIAFTAVEHVLYTGSIFTDGSAADGEFTVEDGTVVTFGVTADENYVFESVTANGKVLSANSNGDYSITVKADITVTVTGVTEETYAMVGSGTESSPFQISTVRDLNYMSAMVNAGYTSYVYGYYSLQNDIDCGGASLDVIGDGKQAFFGGFFNGNGYTVSNFSIYAFETTYVGFFGMVQSNGTAGNNLGTIINFNIDNFEITAIAANDGMVFAGSLIGYGFASNLIVCSATNGRVNAHGNRTYYSYAGGAVGFQQSATIGSGSSFMPFYSVVNYVHTDVDVFCTDVVYAAGGIVGYSFSAHELAPAIVTNSYSEGGVFSSILSGGVVGFLCDYSSVTNCYSTGIIQASSNFDSDEARYQASAGGIAGYAGYNTVISNSFSTASVSALYVGGGTVPCHTDGVVAGHDSVITAKDIVVFNTYSEHNGDEFNAQSADFIKNTLKWSELDWAIANGSLPTINHENTESISLTVTIDLGTNAVDGDRVLTVPIEVDLSYYPPVSDYYFYGELSETLVSDGGLTSYGYFFDSEHNYRVPYGYVITGETTLYAGFADYSGVTGVYYYNYNGRTVTLELDDEGNYTYEDGFIFSSTYYYDGGKIYFNEGLFARLSSVVSSTNGNGTVSYDYGENYETHKFLGKPVSGSLEIYDGAYFTEENPLTVTKTKPAAVDPFKGVWEKSATIKKTYEFDGDGAWSYSFNNYNISGTYSVENGKAVLDNGKTAEIDESGLLLIDGEYYCLEGSLFGVWTDGDSGNFIRFDGYGKNTSGEVIAYIDSVIYEIIYVKDGFFDELNGEGTVTLLSGYSLFGYLGYSAEDKTLKGAILNVSTDSFDSVSFRLVDDYSGEWIGEDSIGDVKFELADFNGFGIYTNLGFVVINGERVEYTVSIENGLDGSFEYKGVTYTISVDEITQTVTITNDGNSAQLSKLDELSEFTLIDNDNTTYTFNGGGYLAGGGKLTVTDYYGDKTEYGYKINEYDLDEKNLDVDILSNGTKTGSLTIVGNNFRLIISGKTSSLSIKSVFTGTWAVNGMFRYNFTVGNFDLTYTASGRFLDMDMGATYTWDREGGYISVAYINAEMTAPQRLYILALEEGNLAIASYPYISSNDNIFYASVRDEVFGVWYNATDRTKTLEFDGLADSKYTTGIAFESYSNTTYFYTRRFGKIYIWEYDDEQLTTARYLEAVSYLSTDANVYNNGGRSAYKLIDIDAQTTPVISGTDADGTKYSIYLNGDISVGNKDGSYSLINAYKDYTEVRVRLGDETYDVRVNHDGGAITLI